MACCAHHLAETSQFLFSLLRATKRVRRSKELTGRDGLHDLVGLDLIINLEGEEVLGGSELELGDVGLLVLLDSDLLGTWKVLLLFSHNLDEFLQVLNFLGLYTQQG